MWAILAWPQGCPLLLRRSVRGEGHLWPLGPPQGTPAVCYAVQCQLLSLPFCVLGGGSSGTAWVFCNKFSYLLLSFISVSIPNTLTFQHHLKSQRNWGRGSGPSVMELMTGGPSGWLVQGHPAVVEGCFLCLACPPMEGSCTAGVLSYPLA